ncbi:MAG: hypothetical protein ABSC47_03490 [Terracidiphilus sp.]|jgi:hypothetical protein
MRLQVSISALLLAFAVLVLSAGTRAQAQVTPAQGLGSGAYIPTDPLANVRYDNRFDISLGAAYGHIKAGPPPLHEGSNLGGLDLTGSYWFSRRWALEGTGRFYLGSSGAGVNDLGIQGPFVSQYLFAAGPEWLGPHNKHGALLAHALFGGADGNFQKELRGYPPSDFSFFNNQIAPAAIIGGHIDLNRSPRWVFRLTPDALYTRYSINYGNMATYAYWNFGISAGVEYKFKKLR